MSISPTEQKILQIKSGNRCAFPGCTAVLVKPGAFGTRPVIIGEIAHIVSASPDGPRGNHLLPTGEHDKHMNLVFLCPEHHKTVDDQPQIYSVERLRQMKKEHEEAVEKAVAQAKYKGNVEAGELPLVRETVHSTLLPVLKVPRFVFGAPCKHRDSQEKEAAKAVLIPEGDELCPFIIRNGNMLFAFNDLRREDGPFRALVDFKKTKLSRSARWWEHPDKAKWFVTLLNRSLNKLTGRRGLMLDKEHHRYFFACDETGKEKSVDYRPLNQKNLTSRKVVWRPVSRKTGEPRFFWNHLAVGLRFQQADRQAWYLSLRPEMRITKDGTKPIESKRTGSRVTREKAHMFNYDLLEDVNFWRDYLSKGRPRIVLRFGDQQSIIISTSLMAADVDWPGIPKEFTLPFANIDYEEDLFSALELGELEEPDEAAEGEFEEDDGEDSND